MEEQQQQQNAPTAFFPAPPPFYKYFTKENVELFQKLRDDLVLSNSTDRQNTDRGGTAQSIRVDDLPPELRYLEPPNPPSSGIFRCFGETIDINNPLPSLREQGIEQVYPSPPSTPSGIDSSAQAAHRAVYLSKLAKSILLNYLELVGALSVNPSQWKKKVDDLQVLFYNAHHLINEYRAHHSRYMLIEMMEEQLDQKRSEIEGLKAVKNKVENVLANLGAAHGQAVTDEPPPDEIDLVRQREEDNQRLVWEALNEI